jgi:alkaline phosphatase
MFSKNQLCKVTQLLFVWVFCLLTVTAGYGGNNENPAKHSSIAEKAEVKNVIFCIGDGMGLGQAALARIASAGPNGQLYIDEMPVIGIIKTHSADSLVTDSAAAGTALATGFKTNNGMVGILPQGGECLTILEAAKENGVATGLVVTSSVTDATPASFGSHAKSRSMQDQIAEGLLANKINVIFGGGRDFFVPKSELNSKRPDERNLLDEAKKAGYCNIQNAQELRLASGPYILGLFQPAGLTTMPPEPELSQLAEKAIEVLSKNKQGFFLMIEGSQIDWNCHKNDANNAIRQTLLFDKAVKTALDFAVKDAQTLVIVTADHETGGLVIKNGSLEGKDLDVKWTTSGHTAISVPLYAFGPGADNFAGVYDNTQIPKRIAALLGIKDFPRIISKTASKKVRLENITEVFGQPDYSCRRDSIGSIFAAR